MTELHPLLQFAMVLSAGLIGGELITRIHLPRVTGWIITGIVLRAIGIPGLAPADLKGFYPFTDFVLGYIAFTVGAHLNFKALKNAGKRLVFVVLTELTITPAIVLVGMHYIGGFPIEIAFIFAAIAVAGAPGTTVLVVRENKARGVFVKTLVAAVALIDMVAVSLFVIVDSVLSSGAPITGPGFIITGFPYAVTSLLAAAGIGLGCALAVLLLTRHIVGSKLLGASLVASIVAAWGIADLFEVSSILAVTFVGMALGNLMGDKEHAGEAYLNTFGDILFTAFYTLAGLKLDFSTVLPMAGLVALLFGGRMLGKIMSTWTSMSLAGAVKSVRNYLGIALLPHGGVAVGLILFVQSDPRLVEWADQILTVGLAALAVNQLIGPSATKWALRRAGEANKDRPRLLDFLREQDIVVNFSAENREDAIRQLADRLYQTHSLNVPKDEFVEQVIEREGRESTCLGGGLMIPHGNAEDGQEEVVGVMGLSEKGLKFDTPDGKPVHAIVLLATPPGARDRHLEVLAAFAKAIGGNREIRDQLYHAGSPAHAYHVLHEGSAADFNYFLEETLLDGEPLK